MAVATRGTASNYLQRAPSPSGLAEVLDVILDKGIVIDAYVRVSLLGIELLTVDARIVVASVDTFLRFAEATNRLDLYGKGKGGAGLPDLVQGMTESGSKGKTTGVVEGAVEKVGEALTSRREEREEAPRRRPRQRTREQEEE